MVEVIDRLIGRLAFFVQRPTVVVEFGHELHQVRVYDYLVLAQEVDARADRILALGRAYDLHTLSADVVDGLRLGAVSNRPVLMRAHLLDRIRDLGVAHALFVEAIIHIDLLGYLVNVRLAEGRRVVCVTEVEALHAFKPGDLFRPDQAMVDVIEDQAFSCTPVPERVDVVIARVRLLLVLHHHFVFGVNERVIQVGGVQGEYALHRVIEEDLFDPVLLADRVEGQDDLLETSVLAPQSKVKLLKVFLCQLGGLFTPDGSHALDGLQLLNVIKTTEHELRAVRLVNDGLVSEVYIELAGELPAAYEVAHQREDRALDGSVNLPDYQEVVMNAGLFEDSVQQLAGDDVRLPGTSAAPGHLIPALIHEQRHECWRHVLDVLAE